MQQNVTIWDVAKRAGVGISTVSRVLNGGAGVNEATRERVRAVIAECGYEPNSNARQLKQRRADAAAVIVRGAGSMFLASILERLQPRIEALGLRFLAHYIDEHDDEAAAARAEGEKARADAQKDAEAAKQEAERIRAGAASQANADARAIIDKANNEARNIIYKAQQDANRLVQADAIRQQAEKEAETLRSQANEDIAKRQADCQQYIAGQLANLDSYMTQMLQNVRNARSQVRGQ